MQSLDSIQINASEQRITLPSSSPEPISNDYGVAARVKNFDKGMRTHAAISHSISTLSGGAQRNSYLMREQEADY
jgi:hypothetical protein